MSEQTKRLVIDDLVEAIEIPEPARRKAEARYKDLGEWFCRDDAHCAGFDPHIYPQGSFRLGTVVRADEYDLDFGCRLREGITKATHTQEQLKQLVRRDLEEYRRARNIDQRLDEKTRCWRLKYKDELAFHMDGVPSIPEDQPQRVIMESRMITAGVDPLVARSVAHHAGAITDNRMPNYKQIDPRWRVSNSEGYAKWFESRMKLASRLVEERAIQAKAGTVDELPAAVWNSPLQRSVQILKCHRDRMFEDAPDSKPISIIITTLSAEANRGERDVADALDGILSRMGDCVRSGRPRVPNPVNPVEDFADKWYDLEYRHLDLERNFWNWLRQARIDFSNITNSRDPAFLTEQARLKYGVSLDEQLLAARLGLSTGPAIITRPKSHQIIETPAQPWRAR